MTLEQQITAAVREAVHAALEEHATYTWPEVLTLKQVEERYRDPVTGEKPIKASTLRALILSGVLEAVRTSDNGAYLVKPEALATAIERLTINKPSSAPVGVKDLGTRPK